MINSGTTDVKSSIEEIKNSRINRIFDKIKADNYTKLLEEFKRININIRKPNGSHK